MDKPKILILGGTGEARQLAAGAIELMADDVEVITSQAGVTRRPESVPGRLVKGGFGGIAGLQAFIEREHIAIVVDATHAFAATISDNAYVACLSTQAKRITLVRPPWEIPSGGRIVDVNDMQAAAVVLHEQVRRAFITTGRRGLEAFAALDQLWFLLRLIDPPERQPPLTHYHVISGRPPFSQNQEKALLKEFEIDGLLSKNSGGDATYGKIAAALEADIPIVLIRRPDPVPGEWTDSIDDCLGWIKTQI